MNLYYRGFLFILLSATGLGLTPIFGKIAFQANVTVETLLFLRFFLAFLCLFAYLYLSKTKFQIHKKQFWVLLLLGCLYCAQTTFYFNSLKLISASLSVMLLYLYPCFVLMFSMLFDKSVISKGIVLSMLLSLVGIGTLLGSPIEKIDFTGVMLAIGSALTYALYIVFSKRLLIKLSPLVTSTWIIFFTALAFLLSGTLNSKLHFQFSLEGWYAAIALAIFSTVISFWALFMGMKYIGPTRASIVSTFEPIVTTVSAVLLLNESISMLKIVGILMVLTSVILLIIFEKQKETGQEKT